MPWDTDSPRLVKQRICMPLLQASAAAVKRTSASEEDSKNGRLDRTLMRMDRALDPKRCLPRQLERCHVQTAGAVAYGMMHHSLLCPNEGRSLSDMSTSPEHEAKLVRVKRLCFMLPSASLRVPLHDTDAPIWHCSTAQERLLLFGEACQHMSGSASARTASKQA